MRYIAGFPLEKVKMSDICFLPLHTSTIKVYVIFLNGSCQEDTAKTSWSPFCGDDTSIYIHFQDLMAASGSQHRWYWSCQQGKSQLLGLTTAVSSLDQLCNVICIALGEGASRPVYPTLPKSLQKSLRLARIGFSCL